MYGSGSTYFDQMNCAIPHFVVTGHTEDRFCDDTLVLGGVEQLLHRHLIRAGFDAVVFFDAVNSLYCLDSASNSILQGREPATPPTQRAGSVSRKGPIGHRVRRRVTLEQLEGGFALQQEEATGSSEGEPFRWPLPIAQAWNQVNAFLQNERHRVAAVFSNVSSLQESFSSTSLQYLQELASERNVMGNIAVYVFRGNNSLMNLAGSSGIGQGAWQTFYNANLLPLIVTDRPEDNRVIVLGPPHASEIENLLNHMRLRSERPLPIVATDIVRVSRPLAELCASEDRELNFVRTVIEQLAQTGTPQLAERDILEAFGITSASTFDSVAESIVGRDSILNVLRSIPAKPTGTRTPRTDRLTPPLGSSAGSRYMGLRVVGASGTGKRTIATLMAHKLRECGYLESGHIVTRRVLDLLNGGAGDTVLNIRDAIQKSLGGMLYVEGFDSLNDSSAWTSWIRAQDELIVQFNAFEGQMALAYAGSQAELEHVARDDARVAQCLPMEFRLDEFTPHEMAEIMRQRVELHDSLQIDDTLDGLLEDFCSEWVGTTQPWQGIHEVDRLISDMASSAHQRESSALGVLDVPEALQHHLTPRLNSLAEAMDRIDAMVGLRGVKRFLRERCLAAQWKTEERVPGCYIFHGPPGTGKTVMARRMGDMLQQLGVLRRHDVVEVTAASLLRHNFSELLEQAVSRARGGVFFLDEAHQLANDSNYGLQVIQALVPIVENPQIRADTCFILAGYTTEMNRFLAVDPGLNRRFPINHRVRFDDYDAHDLTLILKNLIDEERRYGGVTYDWDTSVPISEGISGSEYLKRTELAMRAYLKRREPDFGNGGYMRDVYLTESKAALTSRLQAKYGDGRSVVSQKILESVPDSEKMTLTERDIPVKHSSDAGPLSISADDLLAQERTLLDDLVAKDDVIKFLAARSHATKKGEEDPFGDSSGVSLHLSIAGPVGCGRHTVARAIAAEYHRLGLLDKPDVTFVGKADLEAQYVGHTAGKTRDVVSHALGGMLAVVNPSTMLPRRGDESTFGPEALSVIVSAMSSNMQDLSVVFIDSQDELERFYSSFASVRSMLAHEFQFDDFLPMELQEVFVKKCESKRILLDENTSCKMRDFFVNWVGDRGGLGEAAGSWGNGAEVDRLVGDLVLAWEAGTRATVSQDGILWREVTQDLFPKRLTHYFEETSAVAERALNQLNELTGMALVKESVHDIERRLRYYPNARVAPGYYTFLGNPGVGKTMVARLMGGILKAAGVLSQGHVVERTASSISAEGAFERALKLAKNGVLFIDEAHQLAEAAWGIGVIKKLVPACESKDIAASTCIILAGYPDRMTRVFDLDVGLASRFGQEQSILRFEDYSADELLEIMSQMARNAPHIVQIGTPCPLILTDDFRTRSRTVFEHVTYQNRWDFGNGRFVRNYLHDSVSTMLRRLDLEGIAAKDAASDTLTGEDIPRIYARLFRRHQEPNENDGQDAVAVIEAEGESQPRTADEDYNNETEAQ